MMIILINLIKYFMGVRGMIVDYVYIYHVMLLFIFCLN